MNPQPMTVDWGLGVAMDFLFVSLIIQSKLTGNKKNTPIIYEQSILSSKSNSIAFKTYLKVTCPVVKKSVHLDYQFESSIYLNIS